MPGSTKTRRVAVAGGLVAAACLLGIVLGPALAGDIAHQPRTDDAVGEHVPGGRVPPVQADGGARGTGRDGCRDGCARIPRRSGPGEE